MYKRTHTSQTNDVTPNTPSIDFLPFHSISKQKRIAKIHSDTLNGVLLRPSRVVTSARGEICRMETRTRLY